MKRALFIIVLLNILFSSTTLTGRVHSTFSLSILEEMERGRIPELALGIIHSDEILHLKGYGVPGSGHDVEIETPFFMGSLTKTFTA